MQSQLITNTKSNTDMGKSYEHEKEGVSIKEVAKATSSQTPSPTFFRPLKRLRVSYVDGSVWSKNPTLEVIEEASAFRDMRETAIDFVVSIGTGTLNAKPPASGKKPSAQQVLIKSLSKSDAAVDEEIRTRFPDSEHYCRFEVQDTSELKPEKLEVLELLRKINLEFLEKNEARHRLVKVAEVLVSRRKERANTPAWESFAQHIRYVCNKEACNRPEPFSTRQALLRHWTQDHGYELPDTSALEKVEAELDQCRNVQRSEFRRMNQY